METAMALRLGKLYDALVEAGGSQDVAKEASEQMAEDDRRMRHRAQADAARSLAVDHQRWRHRHSRTCVLAMRRNRLAQLVVRNLEDDVKLRLQLRARRHGRSTEEEVREILRNAVKDENARRMPLGSRLRARFADIGIEDDLPECRGELTRPAIFEA
jgi:antitoxin FitA